MKWLSSIFDNTDKELGRLRRIVAQSNEEAENLLETQREYAAQIRDEILALLQRDRAYWQSTMSAEMKNVATEARQIAKKAEALRAIIMKGEQTSRDLSVLLADSKQLSAMTAERLQRLPSDRHDLDEEIAKLVTELGEQLEAKMEEKAGMREAILREIPKANLYPKKATAEEMIKQVEAVATFLGREVADYFERTNETLVALRHAVGLRTLVDLMPNSNQQTADLESATAELICALHEKDLIKHLERQGLRLPAEVKAAAGLADREPEQQAARGRRDRNSAPAAAPSQKNEIADELYWEEQATAELVALAESLTKGSSAEIRDLAERFAGREERLQARTSAFRARILEARTTFWANTWSKVTDIVGVGSVEPFNERFTELDAEQDALVEAVMAQYEDKFAPVKVKPDTLGELMQKRDALETEAFNELMNSLRLEDRPAYDRLKVVQDAHKKEQRTDEQRVLDELIPEAFAAVWDASRRTIALRPYDVQLIGGIILHEGKIAEMKTGEGKTLVAVAPLYLNSLSARGAHLCTVNEYLVKRDPDWMGPIYKLLGLSVGVILSGMEPWERKVEYMNDITHGTNSEFGFDYLRDNIANDPDRVVQRPPNYCIVDEVDSILIDEARTPLIISGQSEGSAEIHIRAAGFAKNLREVDDYTVDEKTRSAILTEEGIDRAEDYFHVDNLYHPDNFQLVYGVDNALKAHALFKRDKDYVLWQEGKVVSAGERLNPKAAVEVVIVDEFTGRLMQGRRYSEGLHEAIEAKEGIKVQSESQTFATITIQNYFRLYPKLAGMTGTAATEAEELMKIYKLEVMPIPTNKPMIRQDNPDRIYRTERAKFRAVVDEIDETHKAGRPVLVGTVSIEKSEELSKMLEERGLTHSVLNAKQHEREASIVAQAGQQGAITIATNMAGRGTDIVLGFGVGEMGGLHIIGTERHESRRIDNQLRGRAGRQGDNGSTRFFVSVEDEIMRRSGVNQNIINSNIFKSLWEEDMPMEHSMLSKSVEQAQVKMEGFNFDTRKHLVEYDDVINTQRDVIYGERRFILKDGEPRSIVSEMIGEKVQDLASPVALDETTGKRKKTKETSSYTLMFGALKETFPDDIVRRLLRSILTSRIAPLADDGNLDDYMSELEQIAHDAYDGALNMNVKNMDDKLRDFYHIGDVYYEEAGQGEVDFNKLQKSLGLPADVVKNMREEDMAYEDAHEYLSELVTAGFDREYHPQLDKLLEYLHTEAPKIVAAASNTGHETKDVAEARTRGLLEYIDTKFALSPASAARYAEAENSGRSSMLAGGGDAEVIEEVQVQLDTLYGEIETTLGEVFIETNATMPLIAMVDNRLPRSVYRRIEEQLGLEKLEEVENIPLAQLEPDVRGVVIDAFVRWQESDLLLRVIDYLWTRHLTTMEGLRHSIGLQAYGQKDPLVQYKVKAYELFDELKGEIRQLSVLNVLMMGGKAEEARAQIRRAATQSAMEHKARQEAQASQAGVGKIKPGVAGHRPAQPQPQAQRPAGTGNGNGNGSRRPVPSGSPVAVAGGVGKQKIGRNDPCWCGSGKKYKQCHGR